MSSGETIELGVYAVKAETDRGVKASVNYDTNGGDACLTSWLPKKFCSLNEDKTKITMPLWLYKKKYEP